MQLLFFFFTNCIIFRNNNYYHSRILMCRQPTTLIFFNGINLFSRNGVCFPKKDRRELHMFHLSGPVQDTGHLTMWTQLLQSLHFYSLGQTGRVQLSSLSQRLQDKTWFDRQLSMGWNSWRCKKEFKIRRPASRCWTRWSSMRYVHREPTEGS